MPILSFGWAHSRFEILRQSFHTTTTESKRSQIKHCHTVQNQPIPDRIHDPDSGHLAAQPERPEGHHSRNTPVRVVWISPKHLLSSLSALHTCSAPQPASASLLLLSIMHFFLCTATCSNAPHVRWRLNAWNVFQCNVPNADQRDQRASSVFPPVVTHDDAAHEEVENTTADEREHEGGISRDLRWDLEL